MEKLSLFDLTQVSADLISQLIDNGGEITEQLAADLAENKEQVENKAMAYAYTLDSLDAQIAQLKAMKAQIVDREKTLSSSKDRLKTALLGGLTICEIQKIEGASHRITVGKKRAYVNVQDESLIPPEYFTTTFAVSFDSDQLATLDVIIDILDKKDISGKITRKLNKADLLAAMKDGVNVPGAYLVTTDKQLYIK